VREQIFDHRLFQNGGGDLQLTAKVRAVLQVDLEVALDRSIVQLIN
jgi:hypothetical protein